jgi:hypothetical protein
VLSALLLAGGIFVSQRRPAVTDPAGEGVVPALATTSLPATREPESI